MKDYYIELANRSFKTCIKAYFVLLSVSTESVWGGLFIPKGMGQTVVFFDENEEVICMKISGNGEISRATKENEMRISFTNARKKKMQVSNSSHYDGPYEFVRAKGIYDAPFHDKCTLVEYLKERRMLCD